MLGTFRITAPRPPVLHLIGVVLAAAIFATDLALPIGSAAGMLYVGVILLGLWSPWRQYPAVAATACSVLVIVDLVIGRWEQATPFAFMNRPLMIVVFVITAVVVRRFVTLERQALAHLDNLADFKRALDAAAIVATTDVRGRITYVNDKFVEISGYSREELLGQDHRIINSSYHPPEFIRNLWTTIARGRVWHGELRNRAKDGHHYWVDTTIVPFVDETGKPYQYIAIRADITARKQAEDTLTHQAALARVGQMAAVLAHEVRNPLAGIRGAMQVLMGRRAEGDPERAVMQEIVARTESLNDLISDLLLFARPRPPRLVDLDLAAVVADVLDAIGRDPVGQGIVFEAAGQSPAVQGDHELTRAALFNLVLNAAQALQGRGRVLVSLAADGPDLVRVDVRDDGPGIPLEVREQIFEPFFTTKTHGGGLGLSIAQRTAELHGGHLSVDCPAEGGTVFTLTLPRTPAAKDGEGAASVGGPA